MTTLEAIDARLARYRALVAELESLRVEVAAAPPPVEALDAPVLPPKAVPSGNAQGAVARKPGPEASRDENRRRRLAEALAGGPLTVNPLAARAGVPQPKASALLKHPWFRKAGPGLRDPWELTEAGRAALAPQPSPGPTV